MMASTEAIMRIKTIIGLSINAALILGGVVLVSNHVEAKKEQWKRDEFLRRVCEVKGLIPSDIRCLIFNYAKRPEVVAAVAYQESRFKPHICSKAGACGLMQFMEGTALEEKINRFDVVQSIQGGERYLARLEQQFGSLGVALAAYNYGPGNMRRWLAAGAKLESLPVETRNYVLAITGHPIEAWMHARSRPTQLAGHFSTVSRELRP
jgi:hypothetical protein